MADQDDTPMEPVIYLTKEGRPARPLKTVEAAIDLIHDEGLSDVPAFVRARECLHQALERSMSIEDARAALVSALKESKRLWT
jgi:hypothetical protein